MIFQDPFSSLNPRRSVGESIGEALSYHGIVKTKEEQKERVLEVLDQIGLSPDVMHRYPHEFSGGQQQRICIGRAIALNPLLLVCDEAVSALDVSIQAQIINLLLELKQKLQLSYLFISHDLSVIRYMCDYILVMYQGRIVEKGSTEEIFSNPQDSYTKSLLASIPRRHPVLKPPKREK
jgi:ABC-type oligopeptide transport system ATPase subunit